jgi:precorrin-6B methylase 2
MQTAKANEQLLGLMSGFQAACVLGAAAELDVFSALAGETLSATEVSAKLKTDQRATTMLLDALCALELLCKEGGRYRLPANLAAGLNESSPANLLPMLRHQMNCLRSWSELAWCVRQGTPAKRRASIRGLEADRAAFIQAMDNVSAPLAATLIKQLKPLNFKRLLDVGGASGTWTIAFLRAVPQAKAILFDLPDAIPHAAKRIEAAGMKDRVKLVAGDFYQDELPQGADLAWVSAIVHQNSRQQNRALFAKVCSALTAGSRILIRDVVMEPSRTAPRMGALFAINMLVNTQTGGTFTFAELDEDLRQSGFGPPLLLHSGQMMDTVVQAVKV